MNQRNKAALSVEASDGQNCKTRMSAFAGLDQGIIVTESGTSCVEAVLHKLRTICAATPAETTRKQIHLEEQLV